MGDDRLNLVKKNMAQNCEKCAHAAITVFKLKLQHTLNKVEQHGICEFS